METFELKVDVNTPYLKAIRFLGAMFIGFFIATIIFKLKYEGTIDWMNAITGILCSLVFAFFPGASKKHALIIDEEGFHLQNYTFHWGLKKEVKWEKINSVGVGKTGIKIKNSVGSTERIPIPLYTKEQLQELRTYLTHATEAKNIEYLG